MRKLLPLKTGDAVTICHGARRLPGTVELASSNHRSLAISYEGILGGFVHMVPILWEDGHGYVDLTGKRYIIEPVEGGPQ